MTGLASNPAFARRRGVNGERVDAARQFVRQNAVNQAVALQPGLPFELFRHDIDAEMRLPARPVPGMAFVLVRFIHHFEPLGRESVGQLLCDEIGSLHAARLKEGQLAGQCLLWLAFGRFGPLRGKIEDEPLLSSLERVASKSA